MPSATFLLAPILVSGASLAQDFGQDSIKSYTRKPAAPAASTAPQAAIVLFEQVARSGQYAGDVDLAAQRVALSDGHVLWNPDKSSPVSTSGWHERGPVGVSDGHGGVLAFFESESVSGDTAGDVDIFAQHIDAAGAMSWNDGQRSTLVASTDWYERKPAAIPDGSGGAIVVFEQEARSGEYAGDIDIAAQHVSASGELLWNAGKNANVSSSGMLERNPVIVPGANGSSIVIFEMEPRKGERAGISMIMAQRLDANGNMTWNEGQRSSMVSMSTWWEGVPLAVSDGAGGAIVAFEQRAMGGQYAGDVDGAAQRISATGEAMWKGGQQSVAFADNTGLLERPRAIVSDGHGGAIVIYEAEIRSGDSAGTVHIFAQRLDPNGNPLWSTQNGSFVPVATSKWSERNPVAVSDGHGGAIVVFEQYAPANSRFGGDIDLAAQHIDANGNITWTAGNRSANVSESSTYLEREPHVAADGAGGAVIVYEMVARSGEHAGDVEVIGQRIGADGGLRWLRDDLPAIIASSQLSEQKPYVILP